MANRLNVLVGAVLDSNVTKNLNKELAELELRDVAINLTLSKKTLTSFQNAISKAAQEIFDSISLSDDAIKKMGQNIGKGIAKGFEESGESATKYFKEIEKQSGKTADKVIKDTEKIAKAQKKQPARRAAYVIPGANGETVTKNISPLSQAKWFTKFEDYDLSSLPENVRSEIKSANDDLTRLLDERKEIYDKIETLENREAEIAKDDNFFKGKSGNDRYNSIRETTNEINSLNDLAVEKSNEIFAAEQKLNNLVKENADYILATEEQKTRSVMKFTKAKKESALIVDEISEKEIESANKQIAAQEAIDNSVKSVDKNAKRFIDAEEQKQHALKQTEEVVEDAESAVKSFQKVYDNTGDLVKESVKYDFKDGRTKKYETFYGVDENGNVSETRKTTIDIREEELAYQKQKLAAKELAAAKKDLILVNNNLATSESEIWDSEKADLFEKQIESIEKELKETSLSAKQLDDRIEQLGKIRLNLSDIAEQGNLIEKWKLEFEKIVRNSGIQKINLASRFGDMFSSDEYDKIYKNLENSVNLLLKQGTTWGEIRSEIKKADLSAREFVAELSTAHKEAKKVQSELDILDSSLGRFVQFYGFGELFRTIKTGATEIATAIKDVDSSMVELRKVTDETEYAYDKFLTNSAKRAKDLGVTLTDYIDSVTNFARMDVGGFEAAQTVAQSANIMQQVAEDLSADQASEYLISIMKSFNIEANETISIVDTLNNLSNNFAITTDGLGASLVRSAAAMRAANNTLEETAALTIAANNVLQNPETVGNALKTVSINYLVA